MTLVLALYEITAGAYLVRKLKGKKVNKDKSDEPSRNKVVKISH